MYISQEELSNTIRTLWEQHVFWTRMAIVSLLTDSPDKDAVSQRLLRNASDFEMALEPFYDTEIASKFGELLKNHLMIAAQLITAAKEGDTKAAADAEKMWFANADEIAAFLSSVNPYWSSQEWKMMLDEHLELTKAEAISILAKKYPSSIRIFDEIERQALEMADMMSEGIVNQFSRNY